MRRPPGFTPSAETVPPAARPVEVPPREVASVSPFRTPPTDTGKRITAPEVAGDEEAPLTAAEARTRLRAARRARKQYEREEVRRFTWRSRRRRRAWLAVLGVAMALAAFVLVGVYSPVMALRTVQVVGAERISAAQVQAALQDQLGTPLPLIDSAAVKSDLARFSLIRSYRLESRPPHTLVVRVVEREPVGAIRAGTGFELVDAAGVVIDRLPKQPDGYPLIDAGDTDGAAFRSAAAVVAALPSGIRSKLDSVTARTTDDVTLSLSGGEHVVWGSADRSADKAVVLGALLVGHPVGSVAAYDVTSPDSPVIR